MFFVVKSLKSLLPVTEVYEYSSAPWRWGILDMSRGTKSKAVSGEQGSPPQINLSLKKWELQTTLCVCVFSSHSFWTSSSLDVPAGVTQEEGHTGFLIHLPSAVRALIFVARRIQPFLSLVDREVEFCVLTN